MPMFTQLCVGLSERCQDLLIFVEPVHPSKALLQIVKRRQFHPSFQRSGGRCDGLQLRKISRREDMRPGIQSKAHGALRCKGLFEWSDQGDNSGALPLVQRIKKDRIASSQGRLAMTNSRTSINPSTSLRATGYPPHQPPKFRRFEADLTSAKCRIVFIQRVNLFPQWRPGEGTRS
jgi:hypothetical protein